MIAEGAGAAKDYRNLLVTYTGWIVVPMRLTLPADLLCHCTRLRGMF